MVAPSGPGIAIDLSSSPGYAAALQEAELVLPDSGAMVLLWNLRTAYRPSASLRRLSGLRFLKAFLALDEVRSPAATFWIMPDEAEADRNLGWLRENGFNHLRAEDIYIAPDYRGSAGEVGEVADPLLLHRIRENAPRFVIVNIGGGIQEPLGSYLRRNLDNRPTILCTGAAIAFLTGGQASIPPWADRLYLGWALRILRSPGRFLPRYFHAWRLVPLLLKNPPSC